VSGAAHVALFDAFERQIGWCSELGSPFMVRLLSRSLRLLHQDAGFRRTLSHTDPLGGLVPLRWAAALHDLALQGKAPWAVGWANPAQVGEAELDAALTAALEREPAHVDDFIAHAPQTNEVQRSAVLLPGLLAVAQAVRLPLRLIELGASAGLNLWCERWHHDMSRPARHQPASDGPLADHAGSGEPGAAAHGSQHDARNTPLAAPQTKDWRWGDAASAVQLSGQWRGLLPALPGELNIAARTGCDLAPIDLGDARQRRRLQAYVWADQAPRLSRLQAALVAAAELNARHSLVVERADALAFATRQLAAHYPGQTQVVMHSIFWRYLDPAARAAVQATIERAGARATADAPLDWLRMEQPRPDAQAELRCQVWPDGADTLLAHVHPHGDWIDWCQAEPLVIAPKAA